MAERKPNWDNQYELTSGNLKKYAQFIDENRDDPGGGGGGGTDNYNSLSNKPQINGNTLAGNQTAAALGLATSAQVTSARAIAEGADSKAESAQTDASTALSRATSASQTATEALAAAQDAQSAASDKATKNELNAVAARVGVNETNIETLQTESATHATKTELNTVDAKVTAVETKIGNLDDLNPAADDLVTAVNRAYEVDGSTIVRDSTTGELSAVTATATTVGVVKPDGDTITIDADGTVHSTVSSYDDTTIKGRVSAIEAVVPSTASASNKLATAGDIPDISALESSVSGIEAVMPYKIDRVRYNLANTDFPSGLVGLDIATWLNARATDSVFRKPGIHIVELYNTATANYGYFFIQNLGPQGADTVVGYGVAEFKSYYTAGGRPFYFLLKQSTWSLMHDANNMYLETSDLTSTVSSGSTAPITSGGVYSALNTVNYGTATRNSATMTGESFVGKWHKCGKLVMAEVQGNTVASGITSDSNLMTGFPKPLENVALVAQGGTNAAAVGIVLKTDGALRSHYNMSSSTFFHATFTYIAAE